MVKHLKCQCNEIFDKFLLANMKDRYTCKNEKERAFVYRLLISSSISEIRALKVSEILRKKEN